MKKIVFTVILFALCAHLKATTWYASPTGSGSGAILSPFNLQTALSSPLILPGDILYMRNGTYKGRFICNLAGVANNNITVSSYPGEWAVLDGNILPATSTNSQVLLVAGGYVTFKDFEITYSNVVRNFTSPNFAYCTGINHDSGEDCNFINLVIHENPGIAFTSWKLTGGSLIYGCKVYNNGWIQNIGGRMQHGPGFYVQNSTDKIRTFRNNIVFNNFSVGFEVWSASRNATSEFVKNVTLEDNTVFNSGSPYLPSPSSKGDNNILVKTADTIGLNIVKNIKILKNILYHNTDYTTALGTQYEGNSLEVGADDYRFPSENIMINDNFISGRNSGLRLLELNLTEFTNNYVLGRYVNYRNTNVPRISGNWGFDSNKYYTYSTNAFRMVNSGGSALGDKTILQWQTDYGIDLASVRNQMTVANNTAINNPPNVLRVIRNE